MTDTQKLDIIRLYNAAFRRQLDAEEKLDAAASEEEWSAAASQHDVALGEQSGLVAALTALGYVLIREEPSDGEAVDIEEV